MISKTLSIVFFFLASGGRSFADDRIYKVATEKNEIKILSYNLQNLFDAEHDKGKNDFEFLPVDDPNKKYCDQGLKLLDFQPFNDFADYCKDTNWTDEKVELKLRQIKRALEAQGDLPDIFVTSEVENEAVISRLAGVLGYQYYVMTNSPDVRGIDLAVMFNEDKFELTNFEERELDGFKFKTRNLSVAEFKLKAPFDNGDIIAVYPNHWPSQRSPTYFRNEVAKQLLSFILNRNRAHRKGNYHVVALGDFNTVSRESPHPVDDTLLEPSSVGLLDVHKLAEIKKSPYLDKMPQATYYYGVKKEWSFFDRIIVSSNLMDKEGMEVDPISYRIHAPALVSKANDAGERIPYRYNHRTESARYAGYSDHFAVHVKIKLPEPDPTLRQDPQN